MTLKVTQPRRGWRRLKKCQEFQPDQLWASKMLLEHGWDTGLAEPQRSRLRPPALACVFSRCPVARRQRVGVGLVLVLLVVVVLLVLSTGEAEGAAETGGQALGVVVLQLGAFGELLGLGACRRLSRAIAGQGVPQPVQEPRSHGTPGQRRR